MEFRDVLFNNELVKMEEHEVEEMFFDEEACVWVILNVDGIQYCSKSNPMVDLDEWETGVSIVLHEASYSLVWSGNEDTAYGGEEWSSHYDKSIEECIAILRSYKDRDEAEGCILCEIECEEIFDEVDASEVYQVISKMVWED